MVNFCLAQHSTVNIWVARNRDFGFGFGVQDTKKLSGGYLALFGVATAIHLTRQISRSVSWGISLVIGLSRVELHLELILGQ